MDKDYIEKITKIIQKITHEALSFIEMKINEKMPNTKHHHHLMENILIHSIFIFWCRKVKEEKLLENNDIVHELLKNQLMKFLEDNKNQGD